MEDKAYIKSFGIFSTISVAVVGVGIFSYPSGITNAVGTNGWWLTLIGGFIAFGFLYFVYRVCKQNDFCEFSEMCERTLGKVFGKICMLLLALYSIFSMSMGMRTFIEVIKEYLLEKTPTTVLIGITLIMGIYIINGGLHSLIRYNEITFFIMFVPAIVICLFALNNADLTNILPITLNKPSEYFVAIKNMIYIFNSFEIAYLIIPLAICKHKIVKNLGKSFIFISFFYAFVVILCIATFSKKQTGLLLWPTITMIRTINIKWVFIEKWEGVVMCLWTIFYFTAFVNGYYFSSYIVKKVFNFKKVRNGAIIIIPVSYYIALYPKNIVILTDIASMITPVFSTYAYIVFPLLITIFTIIRKRRLKTNENKI